ncbi:homoserine dehydrogenase [Microbaculum marinum]|uniref:homoserine dehydrogenase n=1 Tax=Microbaculum marinum TaxID=1764581 RepID=A0AAW9RFR1_9HYPH
MHVLKVAIAGFGRIGRATGDLLLSRRERYRRLYCADVRLVAVCGSRAGLADAEGLEPHRLDDLELGLTGTDFIATSGAEILVEAGPSDYRTGGPGLAYLRSALSGGLDAIVISKGPLVRGGRELRGFAKGSGSMLRISGAAGAALPAIDLLEHGLLGATVVSAEGILNATTNYLLDAMATRGIGFEEALREAQSGGFAEPDPRNDTQGWDTAAKLLLLANFGLGLDLALEDLAVTGIEAVTQDQIAAWRQQGLSPKLVGRLVREERGVSAEVGIRLYGANDPLARVTGKNKAIRITTDAMGETVAIGSGTEPLATAAAALKDLEHILIARLAGRRAG